MKKKAPKKYMNIIKGEKKKISKSRKQYARIVSMPKFMDYLIGEVVRVVPGPVEEFIYGVVQKEGYSQLALPFEPTELELLKGKPPFKPFVQKGE